MPNPCDNVLRLFKLRKGDIQLKRRVILILTIRTNECTSGNRKMIRANDSEVQMNRGLTSGWECSYMRIGIEPIKSSLIQWKPKIVFKAVPTLLSQEELEIMKSWALAIMPQLKGMFNTWNSLSPLILVLNKKFPRRIPLLTRIEGSLVDENVATWELA